MFNAGQRAAVEAAWRLAGHDRVPAVLPVGTGGGDERKFVLDEDDRTSGQVLRDLEQVLQQLLGCKVAALRRSVSFSRPETKPFY